MQQPDPSVIFDQEHAESYDERFVRMAPFRDSMHLLLAAVLASQPTTARILCAGAGTGTELIYLADKFPGWHFTAVEPSAPMLDVCRRRVIEHGLADRCTFHHGYVDTLPATPVFDAATSILVSHFILSTEARADYFRSIATRLRPGACLVSADLAADESAVTHKNLFRVWLHLIKSDDLTDGQIEEIRQAYALGVCLLPPERLRSLIADSGFDAPTAIFQAGLIHACYAKKK